jgi:hypothetical protein
MADEVRERISPERMNATGRVNSPSSSSVPPTISISPAIPGSDVIGAVPPPGITAAGKPSTFAVPTWMNRKAATMRRMLRRYGLQDRQRANRLESVIDILPWWLGRSPRKVRVRIKAQRTGTVPGSLNGKDLMGTKT